MKRILKLLVLVLVLGGAGFAGFTYWQKKQAEQGAEAPPVAAAPTAAPTIPSPTPAATPETPAAPAAASFDLTAQADEMSKAVATLTMEKGGVIKIRFYPKEAPNTVKRIADLISQGFYNGIMVHRVVPGFVVQAGDPTGTGAGGSGVKLKAEFNARKHEKGILSMARTNDPDSADSQFFIVIGNASFLDGKYTVFGKVVEGYDNVEKIQRGDKIKSFTIQ